MDERKIQIHYKWTPNGWLGFLEPDWHEWLRDRQWPELTERERIEAGRRYALSVYDTRSNHGWGRWLGL
jgi:hypothetical protein